MSEFTPNKYSPPDFEALDLANAEYDAQLEHISLTSYPELICSFHTIIQNLNHIRTSVGAYEMSNDPSVMRLMNQAQWNSLRSKDPGFAGYYDPLSGKAYHLFDEDLYRKSKVNKMMTVYTAAHELSHKATHGLEMYSFNLSEGMADFLTLYALEHGALAPIVSAEELSNYREQYLQGKPTVMVGEDEFRAKDIFVAPNEAGSGFTRIRQLRLIEALQTVMHPEHFNDFLASTFTSDIALMRSVLTKYLGEGLVSTLDDTSDTVDPRVLTEDILQANLS